MSLVMDEKVICPKCGTESTFYLWLSVCSWLDPDAAEMAKNGTLNQFTCKKCGFKAIVGSDVLINEEGKMTLITPPKTEEA